MPEDAPQRNPLLQELQWVHGMLRRDLASCRSMATAALEGAPDEQLRDELVGLQSRTALFQLKVNCLSYCSFVHAHHGAEDASLFPAVRRSGPALGAVVDKLMADHVVVAALLDEVEAAARSLAGPAPEPRQRLVTALETLSTTLLDHLAYEEEQLGPVFLTWRDRSS